MSNWNSPRRMLFTTIWALDPRAFEEIQQKIKEAYPDTEIHFEYLRESETLIISGVSSDDFEVRSTSLLAEYISVHQTDDFAGAPRIHRIQSSSSLRLPVVRAPDGDVPEHPSQEPLPRSANAPMHHTHWKPDRCGINEFHRDAYSLLPRIGRDDGISIECNDREAGVLIKAPDIKHIDRAAGKLSTLEECMGLMVHPIQGLMFIGPCVDLENTNINILNYSELSATALWRALASGVPAEILNNMSTVVIGEFDEEKNRFRPMRKLRHPPHINVNRKSSVIQDWDDFIFPEIGSNNSYADDRYVHSHLPSESQVSSASTSTSHQYLTRKKAFDISEWVDIGEENSSDFENQRVPDELSTAENDPKLLAPLENDVPQIDCDTFASSAMNIMTQTFEENFKALESLAASILPKLIDTGDADGNPSGASSSSVNFAVRQVQATIAARALMGIDRTPSEVLFDSFASPPASPYFSVASSQSDYQIGMNYLRNYVGIHSDVSNNSKTHSMMTTDNGDGEAPRIHTDLEGLRWEFPPTTGADIWDGKRIDSPGSTEQLANKDSTESQDLGSNGLFLSPGSLNGTEVYQQPSTNPQIHLESFGQAIANQQATIDRQESALDSFGPEQLQERITAARKLNAAILEKEEPADPVQVLFALLRPTLVTATSFPGAMSLEFQLGLHTIYGMQKFARHPKYSYAELQSLFFPLNRAEKRPRTAFFKRLTTSPADIDHIISLQVNQTRIFDDEINRQCIKYEFHCHADKKRKIIISVDERGNSIIRYPEVNLGSVHLNFPGQVWDASANLTGAINYAAGVDLELDKIARTMVKSIWVEPHSRLQFLFHPPKSRITIDKIVLERWTRHQYDQEDAHGIHLQIKETQELYASVSVRDSEIMVVQAGSREQMLRDGTQWWRASLISASVEKILSSNQRIDPGTVNEEWKPEDVLGRVAGSGLRALFNVGKKVVEGIDAVGFWNKGPASLLSRGALDELIASSEGEGVTDLSSLEVGADCEGVPVSYLI
ncbi:hypothetical protein N7508_005828 [Penicillium antarcticum]|uniref:uncharacterized protein n=1 Tax=Penicillium antarcticum TaxID=416450 RepID=UPI002398CBBE|nr:uncharacterized protein N7508_005828 [Penicillium antarcticum]KAJ5306813.1 hypothetical protein N7508_005828 [Penicillium antarcticum]